MSDILTGAKAALKYGATPTAIANLTNIEITSQGGIIEASSKSDISGGWKKRLPAKLKSNQYTATYLCTKGENLNTLINTEVAIEVYKDDTALNEVKWTGSVIVTNVKDSADIPGENVETGTIEFESSGVQTYAPGTGA